MYFEIAYHTSKTTKLLTSNVKIEPDHWFQKRYTSLSNSTLLDITKHFYLKNCVLPPQMEKKSFDLSYQKFQKVIENGL